MNRLNIKGKKQMYFENPTKQLEGRGRLPTTNLEFSVVDSIFLVGTERRWDENATGIYLDSFLSTIPS